MNNKMVEIVGKGYGVETEEILNLMFDYYNATLFNGELPKVPVKWNNRMTRYLGRISFEYVDENYVKTRPILIELSKKHHKINDEKELSNTLLHEMIHILHRGHGKGFNSMANLINRKTGLNIGVIGGEKDAIQYYRYKIQCDDCGAIYLRDRNITNTHKCGCGGYLSIIEDTQEK